MTPQKEKALAALLMCKNKKDAAASAGITPRAITKYLADPEFQREYAKAFQSLVDDATREAQGALSPAISVLRTIALDEEENSTARIAACRSLLEYGLRLTEFNDILQEIQQITGGS